MNLLMVSAVLTSILTPMSLDAAAPGLIIGIGLFYIIRYCFPVIIIAVLVILIVRSIKNKKKDDRDDSGRKDDAEH